MADLRISELTSGGAAVATDELPVSRTATVATRKVTAQSIANLKTPGGADTNVQYNDGGAFAGDANFTWNKATLSLGIGSATIQSAATSFLTGNLVINRGGGNVSSIVLQADGTGGALLQGGSSAGAAPQLVFADPTVGTADTFLIRDAANVFAQKNGTTAQEFRIYGTTTGPKYLSLKHDGTDGLIVLAGGGVLKLSSAAINAITGLILGAGAGAAVAYAGTSGAAGMVLRALNASGVGTFSAIDLAVDVTGDLPYANLVPATAASRLLGRGSASGAGDWQEITLGSNLTMTGTTLSASGGSGSTPTGTGFRHVTSGTEDGAAKLVDTADVNANQITNAKLAQMATLTLKGNNTGGASDPLDLTVAQVLAQLGAGYAYARTSNFSYNTDSGERNVMSFTANANDLGTARGFLIIAGGNLLSNSGANTSTWRVKLGSTTLWGDASVAWGNSATRRAWTFVCWLGNIGATNAQATYGFGLGSTITAASVAGLGDIAATGASVPFFVWPFRGTATEDTTANKTLAITHQFAVSNASNELVVDNAVAVLL